MLLELHQSSAGRSRPVAWPLRPGEIPNNKPVTMSALKSKKTSLAAETQCQRGQSRAVSGLGESFFFPLRELRRNRARKQDPCTGPSGHGIQSCSSNCSREHTPRW